MKINELLNALLDNPNQKILINGKKKEIAGFAEFRSVNLGDDSYYKLTFNDHSALCIVSTEDLLIYTDESPTKFAEIADKDIGNVKEITFRGNEYVLENAHDYQYVVRLIKGDYQTIEGEVKFSDYVSKDGNNDLLSLGWIVRTGERADVNPKKLSLEDIEI